MTTKIKPQNKLEKKHWKHQVIAEICYDDGPHYAKLLCIDCGKVMRWLSKQQYDRIMGIDS